MSFHLRKGHRASPELRRVALEELNLALMRLREGDVHQTRRAIKQLRALLHLAGDPASKEISQRLRDAARLLSETRDLEVCIQTLERMAHSVGAAEPKAYANALASLGKFRPLSKMNRERALTEIITTHSRIEEWSPKTPWREIRKTIRHSYQKAQKALEEIRKAEQTPTLDIAEAFHELRKRIKRLWSQLRLVRRCNPVVIGKLIREADGIAELLGAEHDLAILQARLDEANAATPENLVLRRNEYQQAALGLADRFLEKKPASFAKRCFGLSRLKTE